MKNTDIINAWKTNKKMKNIGDRLNTDGNNIYSYNLKIGFTDENNRKCLFLCTSKTGNYYSQTTSSHCELIKRQGVDKVYEMNEDKYKCKKAIQLLYDNTNIPLDLCNMIKDYII